MGVEKIKEIEGCKVNLLRFICILCPINAYMRKIMGDSWSLPQGCLLATLILGAGEYVWVDGKTWKVVSTSSRCPTPGCPISSFQRWWPARLLEELQER